MKKWRKVLAVMLAVMMVLTITACSDTPTSSASKESSTPVESTSSAADESEPPVSSEPEEDVEEEEVVMGTDIGSLPREETLYYNGLQWGTPLANHPFSSNPNNAVVTAQQESTRVLVYETLYMFNQGDGSAYPLLADGDVDGYEFNADQTEMTVKLKSTAKWNDGTAVTAADVKATFDTHVLVSSATGTNYGSYVSEVEAVDDTTVVFKANPDNHNPQKMKEILTYMYILQKDFLDSKLETHGDDYEAFKTDSWFDGFVSSGPYYPALLSSQKIVLQRDDNYWGQDASMWGQLPAPKYIAHNIFKDNDAGRVAFTQGEVDVAQQFMDSVPDMWNKDGLPVSTYYDEPLCYQSASIPSIFFNTTKGATAEKAVRDAIAYAIDYDQINSSAMSGYSPSFEDAPRSLAVPLESEQKYIDYGALADLQWGSRDYARANQVLDDAGIVDSDGDGIREVNGENIVLTAMCPKGWSDWEASLEVVAAAGSNIGIDISTSFVDASVWTESLQSGDFDIIMSGMNSTSISAPWGRAYSVFYCTEPDAERVYWAYHRMKNDDINAMIEAAALETDEAKLKEYYTEISKFLLEEKPVVQLMYRPSLFHTVNESVWTGFPEAGDGTNIPPTICSDGYGVAALYNISAQ